MDNIEKVKQFVREKHDEAGNKRSNNEPYWTHVERVAKTVSTYYKGEKEHDKLVQAALSHDLLEDTKVTENELRDVIGGRATELVIEVTNVFTKENFPKYNRKKRKRLEAERLGRISFNGKIIKIADMIDNLTDVKEKKPKMAKKYIEEKQRVMDEMIKDMPYIMRSKPFMTLREIVDKIS